MASNDQHGRVYDKVLIAGLLTIICCIVIGSSLAITVFKGSKTIGESVTYSIITGLVTSALYAIISDRITRKSVNELLFSQVETLFSTVQSKIQGHYHDYVPKKTYKEANNFSELLNEDICLDIRKSNTYYYCGISGKKSVIRLDKNIHRNLGYTNVVFSIYDPRDSSLFRKRADEAKRSMNENAIDAQDLIDDNLASIVGLIGIRHRVDNIVILLRDISSRSRIEMCSESAYISSYSYRNGKTYNETLRFVKGTRSYQHLDDHAKNDIEVFKKHGMCIEFRSSMTDKDCLKILRNNDIIGSERDWDKYAKLYQRQVRALNEKKDSFSVFQARS